MLMVMDHQLAIRLAGFLSKKQPLGTCLSICHSLDVHLIWVNSVAITSVTCYLSASWWHTRPPQSVATSLGRQQMFLLPPMMSIPPRLSHSPLYVSRWSTVFPSFLPVPRSLLYCSRCFGLVSVYDLSFSIFSISLLHWVDSCWLFSEVLQCWCDLATGCQRL